MTLAENVALPLEEYTDLNAAEIDEIVRLKLALVGLAGFGVFYPSELSGGMRQRAGLARAMALDPAEEQDVDCAAGRIRELRLDSRAPPVLL